MTRTLIRNAWLIGVELPTSIAIEDDRISWLGPDADADRYTGAEERIDAAGALITPAFVDAHVHLVQTGMSLQQIDLTRARSGRELLDLLARYSLQRPVGNIEGWGWDDTHWPDAADLTAEAIAAAAPGRSVYLARIDGHSAVVSPDLLSLAHDHPGCDDSGRLERDAHHVVREALAKSVTDAERLNAARRACAHLAEAGIVGFHENAAPHIGPSTELALVRQAAVEHGQHATLYWGELISTGAAVPEGVAGLAGDLNADGALGSRTAALRSAYDDAEGQCGHRYLDADQIADHVVACTRAGLQAGFHCIGDAALSEIAAGLVKAAEVVGFDALRRTRHRLEHVEMPSDSDLAIFARAGVAMSVQPAFDALWGGPGLMYAQRVGHRWQQMNPFRSMRQHGLVLAFGSDSPVTPIDPWAAVKAAMWHHNPEQQLSLREAMAAHTRGGWAAARVDDSGELGAGWRADLALWATEYDDNGDPVIAPDHPTPRLKRTISAGRTIWRESA